jgi:hypothetical protein
MTKVLNTSVAKDLAELKKLFAPPVLSSEDHNAYYTIMARFLESVKPRDFVELIFVQDLTDSTWEIMRYSQHKTLVIEREHQRHLEIEAERRQAERQKKAASAYWDAKGDEVLAEWSAKRTKAAEQAGETEEGEPGVRAKAAEQVGETKEGEPGEQAGAPTTQYERWLELEEVIDGGISDVDEIVDGPADELDHAEALEAGIEYFEQLDRLARVQQARRNDALVQIEFYRRGLGQHLRQMSDDIIEGEYRHEAPSIAGPGDGEQ